MDFSMTSSPATPLRFYGLSFDCSQSVVGSRAHFCACTCFPDWCPHPMVFLRVLRSACRRRSRDSVNWNRDTNEYHCAFGAMQFWSILLSLSAMIASCLLLAVVAAPRPRQQPSAQGRRGGRRLPSSLKDPSWTRTPSATASPTVRPSRIEAQSFP